MLKCAYYKNMHTLFSERNKKYMETIRFDQLELNPKILRGIGILGFEEAAPIQAQRVQQVLSGGDVIRRTDPEQERQQPLVFRCLKALMHQVTRLAGYHPLSYKELAIQVADEIRSLQNICMV